LCISECFPVILGFSIAIHNWIHHHFSSLLGVLASGLQTGPMGSIHEYFNIFECPRRTINFFEKGGHVLQKEDVWLLYLIMLLVCDLGKTESIETEAKSHSNE